MKLVAIARVKNELDIVEAFVSHHAQHFNKIILLDDGSSDGPFAPIPCSGGATPTPAGGNS
jgi:hypothetical protein